MKVKPRYTVIILTIGILLGLWLGKLTLEPKLIVETEYRTITHTEKLILPYVKFNTIDIEEIVSLLRIVESEATGGNIDQKINVVHTVLNRVESNKFPNTVKEVVFQSRQFSPISDKRYWQVNISDTTVKAVKIALTERETHFNALWFINESHSSKSNVKWFKNNLKFMYDDGLHQYYGR